MPDLTTKTSSIAPHMDTQRVSKLAPIERIEGYVVDGPPKRGGFAAVYRCVSQNDGSVVAIKVLNDSRHDAPRSVRRFEQEIDVIQRLRHPNIVELYGSGSLPDGRPYYLMEWIEGSTLSRELAVRGPLLPADALATIEELGSALSAAHEAGIVHRDIKPSNVMAIPQGRWFSTKLLDFGIAKLSEPDPGREVLTSVGRCLGTMHYMAPEQILCDDIDERTDVYALGVLIYRMLTGVVPFHAPMRSAVQMMHLDDPPPRASDIAPTAAPWDDVIQHCMAKAPSERPASVEVLLEELRAALAAASSPSLTVPAVASGGDEKAIIIVEVGIAPEAKLTADEREDAREDVCEAAAEAAEAAGWTIVIEADDALIASCPVPDLDHSSGALDDLVAVANRLLSSHAHPQVTVRVWIQCEDTPLINLDQETSLPTGLYISRTLAAKSAKLIARTSSIPSRPHSLFIQYQE